MIDALPKLIQFSSYPGKHFSYPRWHPFCLLEKFFWFLNLFKSDFLDYVKCSIPVGNISKVNEVIGIDRSIHKFVDTKEQFVYFPQEAYHLSSSKVCPFSPQVFHQNDGGKNIIFGDWVEIHLTNITILIFLLMSFSFSPMYQLFEIQCALKLRSRRMLFLWLEVSILLDTIISFMPFLVEPLLPKKHLRMIFLPIPRSAALTLEFCNVNLTGPQKELLLWHWKFGIGMYQIQKLMKPIDVHESSDVCLKINPIITPIFRSTPNLKTSPLCQSCWLACSKCHLPKATIVHQLLLFTIMTALILNIYVKASKSRHANLVVYTEPTTSTVPLNLSRVHFLPPGSPIRNSRASNATIFQVRLVIPYWIPCL